MPWFWEGTLQGGGVLNDMMCHSVEEARFMLTPPGAPRDVLTPVSVTAYTNCLKWQEPKYAAILAKNSGGKTDYLKRPSEDFARSLVEYKDRAGQDPGRRDDDELVLRRRRAPPEHGAPRPRVRPADQHPGRRA